MTEPEGGRLEQSCHPRLHVLVITWRIFIVEFVKCPLVRNPILIVKTRAIFFSLTKTFRENPFLAPPYI